MKAKVTIHWCSPYNHNSNYMVYTFNDKKDKWEMEQFFPHNERRKAFRFARDLSRINRNEHEGKTGTPTYVADLEIFEDGC